MAHEGEFCHCGLFLVWSDVWRLACFCRKTDKLFNTRNYSGLPWNYFDLPRIYSSSLYIILCIHLEWKYVLFVLPIKTSNPLQNLKEAFPQQIEFIPPVLLQFYGPYNEKGDCSGDSDDKNRQNPYTKPLFSSLCHPCTHPAH